MAWTRTKGLPDSYDDWLTTPKEPQGKCDCGEEWVFHRGCERCGRDVCPQEDSVWLSRHGVCGECVRVDEVLPYADGFEEIMGRLRGVVKFGEGVR